MSSFLKLSAYVFISLTIGFISLFGSKYIDLFFNQENSAVNVESNVLLNNCNVVTGVCNKKYEITWAGNFKGDSFLVLGRLWNASRIICGQGLIFEAGSIANPIGSRDTNNFFHVISSSKISNCNSKITVDTYFFLGQKKSGMLDGRPFFTSNNHANALKRYHEFILQDFKILNFCAILAVLLFSIFIKIVAIDSGSIARTKLALLLATGALAQSGLLEVWFPFSLMPEVNRWIAAMAYCAYISFAFKYLVKLNKSERFFEPLCFIVFSITLILTQSRVVTWIYYSGIISVLYLISGLYFKNVKVIISGVLLSLATLEFLGIKNMPNSYMVPTFFAILILSENQKAFLSYLKINRLLKMSRLRGADVVLRKDNSNRVHSIVKLFQKLFNVRKITVLNLTDPELIRILQYSEQSSLPNIIETTELPPIFAHIISSGNALINVHEDSNVVASFRRGEIKGDFKSGFFTVLPLFSGKETVGAVALTEYDYRQFESTLSYATFIFCLDILRSLLVEHLLTTPKTDSLNKIKKFFEYINSCATIEIVSAESEICFFADAMAHVFGWRILGGELNPVDNLLIVKKINNFDKEIAQQVLKGKIYAHKDNRQGPLALAVHEIKPVIVPNTKWLEGVVHENTIKFFNTHGTRTAAFVPVVRHLNEDGEKVIGVYWIEGVRGNEITYADRELFLAMMKNLSDRLQRIDTAEELGRSRSSLAQFVPSHLVDAVMRGEIVSEDDHGFLMMFDLKGSTRLAHKISNEYFRESVFQLKNEMSKEFVLSKWILQQYEWDAFYFTRTSDQEYKKINVKLIVKKMDDIFSIWKENLISKFGVSDELSSLSYRVCFTYGNTSRGVVREGSTQAWTFTGDAIAVVSKVENESKKLNGQIFADDSIIAVSEDIEWIKLQSTPHGFSVYGAVLYEAEQKVA